MSKTLGELEDAARLIYEDMKEMKKNFNIDLPDYIEVDKMRFYFYSDGSVCVRPSENIGFKPIAMNATVKENDGSSKKSS